jgi:hypothetical protein
MLDNATPVDRVVHADRRVHADRTDLGDQNVRGGPRRREDRTGPRDLGRQSLLGRAVSPRPPRRPAAEQCRAPRRPGVAIFAAPRWPATASLGLLLDRASSESRSVGSVSDAVPAGPPRLAAFQHLGAYQQSHRRPAMLLRTVAEMVVEEKRAVLPRSETGCPPDAARPLDVGTEPDADRPPGVAPRWDGATAKRPGSSKDFD